MPNGIRRRRCRSNVGEHWLEAPNGIRWTTCDSPLRIILNGERARFEIAGGNLRMIVAFDFGREIAFVKFIGTHAEYDRVDALTVALF